MDDLTTTVTGATKALLANAHLFHHHLSGVAWWLQEQAAESGRSIPGTPQELTASALEELAIRAEEGRDCLGEAGSRLPFAAGLALLTAVLLWKGREPGIEEPPVGG